MKIERPLLETCSVKEASAALGCGRSTFYKSGFSDFLDYYQEDRNNRQYISVDVERFRYWLMVRRGMIALGHWHTKTPLLPIGETMEAKRTRLRAWLIVDRATNCPQCDGPAVQGERGGPTWCEVCGITD